VVQDGVSGLPVPKVPWNSVFPRSAEKPAKPGFAAFASAA
jgi:hypothetical protein